jgi:hypothetical protein
MFDNPNVATIKVTVRGDWAVALVASEQAQRLLADEMTRIVPVIMRGLHNWRGYDAQYQVTVEPIAKEGTTLTG